jgi:hypothetical protein
MKIWYYGSANFMFELLINIEIIHEVLAYSTYPSGRYLISFYHLSLSVRSHDHSSIQPACNQPTIIKFLVSHNATCTVGSIEAYGMHDVQELGALLLVHGVGPLKFCTG